MNLLATSPEWLTWLLVLALLAAALQDAAMLKISNVSVIAVLFMAVGAMLISGIEVDIWQNLVAFAVVLSAGTLAYSKGILGGGDVKLLAAVLLWADGATALKLLAAIFICGGLLALLIISLRIFASVSASQRIRVLRPGSGIPYGIAIAAGAILIITTFTP